jgi:adenine-specific DNA-methyltransferase
VEIANSISGFSPDFKSEFSNAISALAPEILVDGKIDYEKLRELLGEDLGSSNERFGLFWPGKRFAIRSAQEPTSGTLLPQRDQSSNWETTKNIFIEGDNLEVLKVLQKRYHRSIKCIYIDPPYNTGGEFIYPDKFQEGLAGYLEFTQQVNSEGQKLSTNTETDGRFHSNWLNMIYPRLKLARNLLSDDGVILISIDDHEIDNLLRIGKEIFGENNHAATFIWQKKKKPSFLHANVGSMTEYIVAFTRNHKNTFPFSVDTTTEGKKYPLNNAGNTKKTLIFPAGSVTFADAFAEFPAQDMSEGNIKCRLLKKVVVKNYKNSTPLVFEGEWRYSQEKLDEIIAAGEQITISKVPFRPNHIKAGGEVKKMHNLLTPQTYGVETNEDATAHLSRLFGDDLFDNPEPVGLLKLLIKSVTYNDPDAIILDFFAGSGSTGEAVMRLNQEEGGNRSFILVQLPEVIDKDAPAFKAGYRTISELSRKRLTIAGSKLVEDEPGLLSLTDNVDNGFRAFTLAPSNFKKWNVSSSVSLEELTNFMLYLKDFSSDSAQQEALLFELIIKQGIELSAPIESVVVGKLKVFSFAEHSVLLYLDEATKPNIQQWREIIDLRPGRLVVLDDVFMGDDELKTNLTQMCNSASIELWTV